MRISATTLALALPTLAAAHDYTVGDLRIIHPRILETAATAKSGGYVTIVNEGATADALIDIEADFPRLMLHESYRRGRLMRMQHVDKITVPADGIAELAPGGYHVMIMGLSSPSRPATRCR